MAQRRKPGFSLVEHQEVAGELVAIRAQLEGLVARTQAAYAVTESAATLIALRRALAAVEQVRCHLQAELRAAYPEAGAAVAQLYHPSPRKEMR